MSKELEEARKKVIEARDRADNALRESSKMENHEVILLTLGRLEGKVDGINQRLDTTNGRTSKLEAKVDSLEKTREQSKGMKSSWREVLGFITGIGGVGIALLSLYFSNKK